MSDESCADEIHLKRPVLECTLANLTRNVIHRKKTRSLQGDNWKQRLRTMTTTLCNGRRVLQDLGNS